ncbi:gigaxonin [Aplysia californica]|uniref:Gigaxonin n=1 Tax=Aplysia californica TaxID=6500 RepID=A0ABM0JAI4_APLCA|nr:gigaxonin [Aplysia californica]
MKIWKLEILIFITRQGETMAEDPLADEPHKKYFYHEHASKLLKNLNETRHSAHLCDATVLFGDKKIPVQKSILSSASPYFRALFDYDSQLPSEPNGLPCFAPQGSSVVSLDNMGISELTFQGILDFIYTAEVELNPENIQNMLQAADQLLMGDLKRLCCEFLDTCITTQNCIGVFDFTSQLSCSWSHLKVSQYLDENFSEVSQHGEFLHLNAHRVEKFLSRKTISVREDEVLDIIIRWFQHKPEIRKDAALSLVESVVFATEISDNAVLKLGDLGELGEEVFQVLRNLKIQQEETPPIQRGYTRVVVACGGEGYSVEDPDDLEVKDYTRCVRLFDGSAASQDCWVDLAQMTTARVDHGVVEVAGYLYAAGGRDKNSRILNSCEKYDPFTNSWSRVASMNHARKGFGLVAIENFIYAIGGSNDLTDPLTSMEVYDMFTDKWKSLPDMIVKKAWASCTAAGKKIYVIGGGIVEKYYDSVEVFDTQFQTWYAVSPLRERRCFAQAVAVGNDIYVFGGQRRIECPSAAHSGHNVKLCGSECYSARWDSWRPLHTQRYEPGFCSIAEGSSINSALCEGDWILVVGELNMNGEWHAIRALNRHTLKWECLVANGPDRQRRYPCCALNIPSHVLHQLFHQRKLHYTEVISDK